MNQDADQDAEADMAAEEDGDAAAAGDEDAEADMAAAEESGKGSKKRIG